MQRKRFGMRRAAILLLISDIDSATANLTVKRLSIYTRLLLVSTTLLVARPGLAAPVTWDGGTTGNNFAWTAASNWNPDALPTLNDNVQFNLLTVGAVPTLMTLSTGSTVAQSITFAAGFNATNTSLVQNNTGTTTATTIRLYGDANSILLDFRPGSGSFTIQNGATAALNTQIHNSGKINVNPGGTLNILGALNKSTATGATAAPVITKTGGGTLVLGGATGTFAGSLMVDDGTLLDNGSLPATTSIQVNIGGTLGGTGTVNPAAPVSIAAGGTLAPGAGLGTLNTGPVAFADASVFAIEIGATTADQLLLTGAASLAGTVALNLTLLADPVDDTTFTILNASAPLTGYFGGARFAYLGNPLDEGEVFTATTGGFTQDFEIGYTADGGNDVTLHAVPEPGTLGSLLGGAGLLLGLRRRAK